jgi:hypothetical protein
MSSTARDVFLSHASEDKERYVRPFAEELTKRGVTYWLDEAEIKWGDRITQRINEGLGKARYVIVFLSHSFLGKNWPESELGAALNKEAADGTIVVLPLILGDPSAVLDRYPLLRDKVYLKWAEPLSSIVDQLEALIAGRPVASTGQEADSMSGPTIADLYGEVMHTEYAPELRRFLMERPELDEPELPISKLMDQLPHELKGALRQFVETYRKHSERIREAMRAEPPSDGSLQIVSIGKTHEAEFDVMLRNLSNQTVYITRITLRVLKDQGPVAPFLRPSARYKIPVGHLSVGESNSLDVSHIIEPHKADRFLIALHTTRVLYLRLTLEYNRYYSVSENAWLWR